MNTQNLGALKRIGVSEVWPHEAHNFTPWLCENLDLLGKVLSMDLEMDTQEAEVGDFSLDILARDNITNSMVVIENQYGTTDHKHLGQTITYASGYDAKTIVWISEEFREEHRQAIDWLNQNTQTGIEFYAVVAEVLQIDDSKPAINFKLVAFPNDWQKEKKAAVSVVSEKKEAYRHYFQDLIDTLREKHRFTSAKKGQPQNWYSFSSGNNNYVYGANFKSGNKAACEVYIDTKDRQRNKKIFDKLHAMKDEIESKYGKALEWERLDNRRSSRITIYMDGCIEDGSDKLAQVKEWMVKNLLQLKDVFPKHIDPLL